MCISLALAVRISLCAVFLQAHDCEAQRQPFQVEEQGVQQPHRGVYGGGFWQAGRMTWSGVTGRIELAGPAQKSP